MEEYEKKRRNHEGRKQASTVSIKSIQKSIFDLNLSAALSTSLACILEKDKIFKEDDGNAKTLIITQKE